MNVHSGIQEALKIDHQLLVEALSKKAPDGFTAIKQFAYVKNLDKIRKQLEAKHGKDNIVIKQGHARRFKQRIEWFNDGAIVYLRDSRPARRRSIFINGKEVEAGSPDWSKQCKYCNAKPVVPQTGCCGPCQFGDMDTDGGKW